MFRSVVRHRCAPLFLTAFVSTLTALGASQPWQAPDLTPVTQLQPPSHPPLTLVKDGKPNAVIVNHIVPLKSRTPQRGADVVSREMVRELQDAIRASTGAKLPIVKPEDGIPAGQIAIVLGDCPEAEAAGLKGSAMTAEGFVIKTTANRIFIVGNDSEVAPFDSPSAAAAKGPEVASGIISKGTSWGIADFLERFVGVRWYYPKSSGGRSVIERAELVVPPTHLQDAPTFRYRLIWPDVQIAWYGKGKIMLYHHIHLRTDYTWPYMTKQHHTAGPLLENSGVPVPNETIEVKADGSRPDPRMMEYSDALLKLYVDELARHYDDGEPLRLPHIGHTIVVSPWDHDVAQYGAHAKLWSKNGAGFDPVIWDRDGGRFGSASRILATFVARLAKIVHKRWPFVTIGYYPVHNYNLAPNNISFPGNVEVQVDNMFGMAMLKEPSIWDREQALIDKWQSLSGRPVQTWFHIYRPLVQTEAPYEFPHVIQKFYRHNRDKIVGSFVTGHDDYWPRQHISMYVWMKCLWNPDIDVDATIDEYCRRMYGKAAPAMRELVGVLIDGWEKSRWPVAITGPKNVYTYSYPPEVIDRIRALHRQAYVSAVEDPNVVRRLDYFSYQFPRFFVEAKAWHDPSTLTPLRVKHIGQKTELKVDGVLDDLAWKRAIPETLVVRDIPGQRRVPEYPTTVRAVWNYDGVFFAYDMTDPTPDKLATPTPSASRDAYTLWRDNDNVELLLDVTGQNRGEFHQVVVTPTSSIKDAWLEDETWDLKGHQIGVAKTDSGWTVEIYIPFRAFKDVLHPGNEGVIWHGQLARHRVSGSGDKDGTLEEESRLNYRFNTCHQGHYRYESNNRDLIDFAPIIFLP